MTSKNVPTEKLGHIDTEPQTFEVPGVGELQDVDDVAVQAALSDVGPQAHQPDDHPYDADSDPDSDYTARERSDSQHAKTPTPDGMRYQPDYPAGPSGPEGGSEQSLTLNPAAPAAAPRAGG